MILSIPALLAVGECEWLDFKQEHHANKADLVHDVLCLANAEHGGDRYLLFGIRDTDHVTVGVEADSNRRRAPDVINLFQSLRLNQIPVMKLVTVQYEGHDVDLLTIEDMPEKPYFMLQEYSDGRERIRAGAVYLRVGENNTPKDRTADDVRVERMYRERFGIDRSPLERARTYLRDTDRWERDYADENRQFFRYEPFPEFTFMEAREENDRFDEPWVRVFPDNTASRDMYYLKYHGTVLATICLVWCDGGRYVTVMPNSWSNGAHADEELRQAFYFVEGSTEVLVNEMVQKRHPLDSRHYLWDGFAMFESDEEAGRLLAEDLAAGALRYTFYRFDRESRSYFQITNGVERKLPSRRSDQ